MEAYKRVLNLTHALGFCEYEIKSERLRRLVRVFYLKIRVGIFRIYQDAKNPGAGNKFVEQLQALGTEQIAEESCACDITGRTIEIRNKPIFTGSLPTQNTMGIWLVRHCITASRCDWSSSQDDGNLMVHQFLR